MLPNVLIGAMLVVMGCLTVTNQVKMGEFEESTHEFRQQSSEKLGNKIFVPAVSIGVMALILSLIQYNKDTAQTFFLKLSNFFSFQLFSFGSSSGDPTALDGAVMTGIACLVAFVLAIIICKPKLSETRSDTSRLLMQVGASCLLPQLLGALGSVFNEAGVGDVISSIISSVVPSGNIVIGVIVYVLGMVIFTMIMGNALLLLQLLLLELVFHLLLIKEEILQL